MGRVCAIMPGWRYGILGSFRNGYFWSFPCLLSHHFLPLSPESGFCFAHGHCESVGSIRQDFSGGLFRQINCLFVGGIIAGLLSVSLPLEYRTDLAVSCGCFCQALLPGRLFPGFQLAFFISLPEIGYCQHLRTEKSVPDWDELSCENRSVLIA